MSRNSSGSLTGGPRSLGIPATLGDAFRPGYQISADPLARRRDFYRLVNELARYCRRWAVTKKEYQVCYDASRPIPRVSVDGWDVLCDLASRSENPTVLPEIFTATVSQRRMNPSPLCVHEASHAETESNHYLNLAQLLFAREQSPVRLVQMRETAVEQAYATTRLIEALDWRLGREAR